jgi:hypothetical protein
VIILVSSQARERTVMQPSQQASATVDQGAKHSFSTMLGPEQRGRATLQPVGSGNAADILPCKQQATDRPAASHTRKLLSLQDTALQTAMQPKTWGHAAVAACPQAPQRHGYGRCEWV